MTIRSRAGRARVIHGADRAAVRARPLDHPDPAALPAGRVGAVGAALLDTYCPTPAPTEEEPVKTRQIDTPHDLARVLDRYHQAEVEHTNCKYKVRTADGRTSFPDRWIGRGRENIMAQVRKDLQLDEIVPAQQSKPAKPADDPAGDTAPPDKLEVAGPRPTAVYDKPEQPPEQPAEPAAGEPEQSEPAVTRADLDTLFAMLQEQADTITTLRRDLDTLRTKHQDTDTTGTVGKLSGEVEALRKSVGTGIANERQMRELRDQVTAVGTGADARLRRLARRLDAIETGAKPDDPVDPDGADRSRVLEFMRRLPAGVQMRPEFVGTNLDMPTSRVRRLLKQLGDTGQLAVGGPGGRGRGHTYSIPTPDLAQEA